MKDSIETVRDGGRICHTGLLANEWGKAMPEMPRDITYEFGDSQRLNADRWTTVWKKIVARVEAGHYRPNIFNVFAFEDVIEAHRMMEESRAAGKLVVVTSQARSR
jgi:NADPH:quinone reductase-like Zn-dependent oxidoreductase